MKLAEQTDSTIAAFLQETPQPTVLVFHTRASKPARTMLPVVQEVADSLDGIARFALVDALQADRALAEFGVLSLPTYLVFKNGRVVDRFIGLMTKEKLAERVEASLQH